MSYYTVADITNRRISEDTGAVEYAVTWDSGEGQECSWERRQQLVANCAEMIQAVDQRCMDATDTALAQWRRESYHSRTCCAPRGRADARKRSRSPTDTERRRSGSGSSGGPSPPPPVSARDGDDAPEVLYGLLLRNSSNRTANGHNGAREGNDGAQVEEGTVLMLGEVVLAEGAAAALNGSATGAARKRKANAEGTAAGLHTSPAVEVERAWREAHGHSLHHSVDAAPSVTPFRGNFRSRPCEDALPSLGLASEAARGAPLRVVSIVPPTASRAGAVFSGAISLEGLVGEGDVENMVQSVQSESPQYGATAQELAKPHVEQMVVRYITDQRAGGVEGGAARHAVPLTGGERVAAMPLSIFRYVYPQLLIDYLLDNSVVLH